MQSHHFAERGWLKVPALVSPASIDRVLQEFGSNVLPSTRSMHRQPSFSQTSGAAFHPHGVDQANVISSNGFLVNGLKDPHNWGGANQLFSALILDVLSAADIRRALCKAQAAKDWVLHATMFFDRNQETEPHQDIYYIDTVPSGGCLGFWLALEDIDERAGRFYFVEGSHLDSAAEPVHPMLLENKEHLDKVQNYVERNRNRIVAPEMRKGDALIFHGRTIHGSMPIQDERFSRKSLTAHFIDSERMGKNRFREFSSVEIRTFNDLRYVAAIRPHEAAFGPEAVHLRDVLLGDRTYRFLGIDRANGERIVLALEAERDRAAIDTIAGALNGLPG